MQLFLLVLGTTLVAVSAVLASVLVDRRERERKRLESRLASSQQQLRASWEWEHAAQQKVSAGETLLGFLRLGLMSKQMYDLVMPRARPGFRLNSFLNGITLKQGLRRMILQLLTNSFSSLTIISHRAYSS